MDPNSNLTPGVNPAPQAAPNPSEADLASLTNELSSLTPEAAAQDINIAAAAAPTVSSVPDPTVPTAAPEPDGAPVLAPSADFDVAQAATVSAIATPAADPMIDPMAADPMSAAPDPMAGMPDPMSQPTESAGPAAADFTGGAEAPVAPEENFDNTPITPAAPVPGSIGSAKSFADVQREEQERAARIAAAKAAGGNGSKMNPKMLIMIAIIAVLLIGGGIIAFIAMNSGNKQPQVDPTPVSYDPVIENRTCSADLEKSTTDFFASTGGTEDIEMTFTDDELTAISKKFTLNFANEETLTNPGIQQTENWLKFVAGPHGELIDLTLGSALVEEDEEEEEETPSNALVSMSYEKSGKSIVITVAVDEEHMQEFINAGYFDEDIIRDNTNFDIIGTPVVTQTGSEIAEPTDDSSDEVVDESETAEGDYSAAHLVEVIEKEGIFTCSEA